MGIINRNNYEIYFLDYLEGNLNPELKQEMNLFLITNPDLKEELDGLDDAILPEDNMVFSAKQSLKKFSIVKRPVRFATDDDFLIAKLEGDLTTQGEIVFESFIKENKDLEKEYSLYKLTKLQPDQSIVFEFKSSLIVDEISTSNRLTERPARFTTDDEFLTAKIENDLSEQDEIVFESYLKANPLANKDYLLFKQTILEPDQTILFENKSSLKRFQLPSKFQQFRKYSYAVASVAAVLLFVVFFLFEKEEPLVSPENSNYLSLVHRSSQSHEEEQENKISFTGTAKSPENENQEINMEIKIRKTLHASLTNNDNGNVDPEKNNNPPQNNKVVIDESFNPDNLYNAQNITPTPKNTIADNSTPKSKIEPEKTQTKQSVSVQKAKKSTKSDNSGLTFLKVASMGIRGLSNLTGSKMELKEQYDENGNVKSLAFNSSKLEISAPIKKK